jgi:predicted small lipoprotein YifL
MQKIKYLFCSLLTLFLLGCGQQGPLYLPGDEAPIYVPPEERQAQQPQAPEPEPELQE